LCCVSPIVASGFSIASCPYASFKIVNPHPEIISTSN
jgi:hypothetical protein